VTDHALYEGSLGNFTSHVPVSCSVAGSSLSFTPQVGHRYFLVVTIDAVAEGSYGVLPDGTERPRRAAACRPQQSIVSCP
jgi:hypothetical protein